jgi:hypothetical protein
VFILCFQLCMFTQLQPHFQHTFFSV